MNQEIKTKFAEYQSEWQSFRTYLEQHTDGDQEASVEDTARFQKLLEIYDTAGGKHFFNRTTIFVAGPKKENNAKTDLIPRILKGDHKDKTLTKVLNADLLCGTKYLITPDGLPESTR